MPGQLFLVATPIGNLGDITFRAVEILKAVDTIACEDTRRTDNLLRHLDIRKPLLRYDEHVHERASRVILDRLNAGQDVALVTDAGSPAVSDPGARLVRAVMDAGRTVVPIPGPSSLIAAVSASGFSGDGFVFLGFLPRKEGRAKRMLQEALGLGKTVVLFESPFRVDKTLQIIVDLSPESPIVVGRELTKLHEEFIRGRAAAVRDLILPRAKKGEFVVVIGPPREGAPESD